MFTSVISGNLVRDFSLKTTNTGKSIGKMTVAINKGWGDNKKTIYLDVDIWGKTAEACQRLGQGSKIIVRGDMDEDKWEGKDGTKRSKLKLVAQEVEFVSIKEVAQSGYETVPEGSAGAIIEDAWNDDEIIIPGEDN